MTVFAFTDTLGRTWELPPKFDLIQSVKAATGIDFFDLCTTQDCLKKLADVYLACVALETWTAPQQRARGITGEQFREGLDGEVIRLGIEAMVDAAVFFSPKDRRPMLQELVSAAREVETNYHQAMLERVRTNMDRVKAEALAAIKAPPPSSGPYSSSPGLSESTPASGAFDNCPGPLTPGSRKRGNRRPRS